MASNYSSASIFFAPSSRSRRTRTIRFSDDCSAADESSKIPHPPASPKDIMEADLKLAMQLQREENMLAMQAAVKRRNHLIQAGRNRTGRSCAHGFGLGTRGVACRADRDLVAEQQEQAESEAGAVEVKYVDDSMEDDGGGSAAGCSTSDGAGGGSPERRTPKNDELSACSEASSSASTPRRGRRVRQSSSGVAAMKRLPPPLGYRLNSGLTDNPRIDDEEEEDDHSDDSDEEGDRTECSPLRPTINVNIHHTTEDCNQDCLPSTPTKRTVSSTSSTSSVPSSPLRMPIPPPSILKNRLTKRPPSDLNLVGRVNTAETVDTADSTEAATTPTPTSANKQPAWLEALEQERKLKKNAQDTGKAAAKLLAETLKHNDSARRRSGFGLFAPTWGANGSPGRSGSGVASYDRRNLPTTY